MLTLLIPLTALLVCLMMDSEKLHSSQEISLNQIKYIK